MRVLVTGASGFVGGRLAPALVDAGYEVRAMTRHPERYTGAGAPVPGDVHDAESLVAAMEGCEAAYYLVHSLDDAHFAERDADAARTFAKAPRPPASSASSTSAASATTPTTCRSTCAAVREVERLLGGGGVPVTVLRAGIVVGHGGISWELTRQLVEHLPAMITPRWVRTRCQPIAVADVVRYLVGVLPEPRTTAAPSRSAAPRCCSTRR
jgi:uncharacterized protein YbjT (DUF2867 family)